MYAKSLQDVQILGLILLYFTSVKASLQEGDDSIQIFNVYTKKCLSFASNNRLSLATCTNGHDKFFKWTADGRLKGAHSGNQNKCIQINVNNNITTGECASQYTTTWTCKDRTLKPKTGNWYLTWNTQTNQIELTKESNGTEALWVLLDTDNSICDWPSRPSATPTTPFIQPTTQARQQDLEQIWPQGYYTLPKAASGCPGATNFTWKEGWIFQDLDDTDMITTKSSRSFNMAAMIDEWGNIKRWFCTKNDFTHSEEMIRPLWPKGTYCIYSAAVSPEDQRCPKIEGTSTFSFGNGYWDNQYWLNDSEMKGVLPRGDSVPGGRTNIYFCCQDKQHPNIPISLPANQPFYLLAFKSSICQKVKWATVTPEFIVYDTSDFKNNDKFMLALPFNATVHDPKIFYCYYEGCNQTLNYVNEVEAEINFPRSQFVDLTSQSCSWRIIFPPDYVILLNVLSLDIPSNQSKHCNVQFLEISGIEQENVSSIKLCGSHQQYKLRSQLNSVLILLQLASNVTKTTGFRLNFKGISSTASSTWMPTTKLLTTERSSESTPYTVQTSENFYSTEKNNRNSENPDSTSTSTAGIQTAAAAETKNTSSKVATTSIVVPITTIVVLAFVAASAWRVTKKRKKQALTNISVKFQNDYFAEENPVYEKDPQQGGNVGGNSDDVTFYESIDNDLVSHQTKYNHQLSQNPFVFLASGKKEDNNCNPLYESADQVQEQSDYSSTDNTLYVSADC